MGPIQAQSLAALIATNLAMLSTGMIFGWSSPSLPKLLAPANPEDPNDLRVTRDEGSWIVSMISIGAIFGPIFSSLLVDRIGRKWTLNILALPIFISWLIIGLATSVVMLYVGRFIAGLSVGMAFALIPIYLGEIAEDRIRGALGTMMSTLLNIGMILTFSVGPFISRQMLSIVLAIPLLISLLIFQWMPETPYYLLMKGNREEARKSLFWLRRRHDVEEELSKLEKSVIEDESQRANFGVTKLFRKSGNRRAFFIGIGLLTFQQSSGTFVIQSYASWIFENSGLIGWSSYSVIIMGCFNLVAGIVSMFVIDVAGRRPILMFSATFTAIFLFTEAVFFHLKNLGYDTSSFSWTPLLGAIGFYISSVFGITSIPFIIIGELFPTDVKATATMLLSIYVAMIGSVIVEIYQFIAKAIGVHWAFYAFATVTLISVIFDYVCVPETKRISLDDIQEYLKSGRSVFSKTPFVHRPSQKSISIG